MINKLFSIIVSLDNETNGIGKNGDLCWKISEDTQHFKKITTDTYSDKSNIVIMGRKTWESIPLKYRPLNNRINIIISRDNTIRNKLNIPDNVLTAISLDNALEQIDKIENYNNIFIIGGEILYKEAILSINCNKLYITKIYKEFSKKTDYDTFFPDIPNNYRLKSLSPILYSVRENCNFQYFEYENSIPLII
jgi:dihydrofolate reductase